MAQTNPQPATTNNNVVWIYLSYILGWIFALIGLAVVKDDDRVRFHCAQALAYSVVTWVIAIVIGLIPFLGWVLGPLLWVAIFVIGLVLALQAGSGKDPKLPVLADFAEKNLVNLFK